MKALVKRFAQRGLWLVDMPIPQIKKNEVLVKVEKAAICGTDVHIYQWDEWAQHIISPPLVIGHEFVGRIIQTGELVTRYKIGDRVSAEGHVTCGVCRRCRGGQRHLCQQSKGIGVNINGCFAEYMSIPEENLWSIPETISDDYAAIFDPLGNAVHAAFSFDLHGEDVLITGAGPIGSMVAGICRMVHARNIVVTDVNNYRLDIAKKMGATRILNIKEESIESVIKELGMIGFDVGLEMSGDPSTLRDIVSNMFHGGKIAILGITKTPSYFDSNPVVFKGLTIKGIYGREMFETWYKATDLIKQGLNLDPVITNRFSFTDFIEAFSVMESGHSGKIILNMN